jgi:hypothetical protein
MAENELRGEWVLSTIRESRSQRYVMTTNGETFQSGLYVRDKRIDVSVPAAMRKEVRCYLETPTKSKFVRVGNGIYQLPAVV